MSRRAGLRGVLAVVTLTVAAIVLTSCAYYSPSQAGADRDASRGLAKQVDHLGQNTIQLIAGKDSPSIDGGTGGLQATVTALQGNQLGYLVYLPAIDETTPDPTQNQIVLTDLTTDDRTLHYVAMIRSYGVDGTGDLTFRSDRFLCLDITVTATVQPRWKAVDGACPEAFQRNAEHSTPAMKTTLDVVRSDSGHSDLWPHPVLYTPPPVPEGG
jgi:hypothetical protein